MRQVTQHRGWLFDLHLPVAIGARDRSRYAAASSGPGSMKSAGRNGPMPQGECADAVRDARGSSPRGPTEAAFEKTCSFAWRK